MMADRPAPERDVSVDLARRLLGDQFPHLVEQPLRELSRGWDNTILRLGDDLLMRIPHREPAASLIDHEQRWLPDIAARTTLHVPAPIHHGKSTRYFPWPWSITPWFEGSEAATRAYDAEGAARKLGKFFSELHVPNEHLPHEHLPHEHLPHEHLPNESRDVPQNPYRGGSLRDRADAFVANLEHLEAGEGAGAGVDQLREVFETAMNVPRDGADVWLHGDLHLRNMLVHDGALTAIIDWGDITVGDRATDFAVAWSLVPDHVDLVRQLAGGTDAAWERSRGWAAHFAVMYLVHSDDDPVMRRIGEQLRMVLSPREGDARKVPS